MLHLCTDFSASSSPPSHSVAHAFIGSSRTQSCEFTCHLACIVSRLRCIRELDDLRVEKIRACCRKVHAEGGIGYGKRRAKRDPRSLSESFTRRVRSCAGANSLTGTTHWPRQTHRPGQTHVINLIILLDLARIVSGLRCNQ